MKPFKINRDSWHYKLNKNFSNDSKYRMEFAWEPRHNNFCSYWRATMFRVFFVGLTSFVALGLIAIVVIVAYQNPLHFALGVAAFAGIIATIMGLVAVSLYIEERQEANKDAPKSLFAQKYMAYKSKVCPMVEYEGKK